MIKLLKRFISKPKHYTCRDCGQEYTYNANADCKNPVYCIFCGGKLEEHNEQ